jgi:hypothetical protein
MGVRILEGKEGAVFYCSTRDWAFGPLMESREEAEGFLEWLKAYSPPDSYFPPGRISVWCRDPRQLTDSGLERAYSDFRLEWDEKRAKHKAANKFFKLFAPFLRKW